MKFKAQQFLLVLGFICTSCQVTETIHFKENNSGIITVEMERIEKSYQLIAGEEYNADEVFEDTTYVFDDILAKHNETYLKLTPEDKAVFNKYKGVKVHVKKSSYEKDFRTSFSQNFEKATDIADLYKTQEYVSDIIHNYALSAEEHFYKVEFQFDHHHFKRVVTITDEAELKKTKDKIELLKTQLPENKIHQKFTLLYHFPNKILKVSPTNAKISSDQKSVEISFGLLESLMDPVSTSVSIELEK